MSRKINYTTISRDGLVGEWLLDGNTNDTSGNGKNGTATNVSWVDTERGYISKCASFNGSSSRIGNDSITDIGNVFTISLWIKSTQSGSQSLLLDINDNSSAHNRLFIAINRDNSENYNDGYLCFFGNNGSGSSNLSSSTDIGINDGTWKHIVGTRDGNNNNKMYVNGKEISTTGSIPSGDITSTYMTLGAVRNGMAGYFYDGNMCLLRPYNRVLSNSEIQSLYQEGLKKLGPTVGIRVNGVPVYSLPNLEQGKILEISKPQVNGTYYDQTGRGHNGTANSVTDSTVGKSNVMSFNGSSSYIDLGNKMTDAYYGISVWANITDNGNRRRFVDFGEDSGSDWQFVISKYQDTNKINYRNGKNNYQSAAGYLIYNERHHYVIYQKGDTIYFYRDGILHSTTNTSETPQSHSRSHAYIGKSNWSADSLYKGQKALLRIYNRPLSPTEIQQLYYAQKGNFIN